MRKDHIAVVKFLLMHNNALIFKQDVVRLYYVQFRAISLETCNFSCVFASSLGFMMGQPILIGTNIFLKNLTDEAFSIYLQHV